VDVAIQKKAFARPEVMLHNFLRGHTLSLMMDILFVKKLLASCLAPYSDRQLSPVIHEYYFHKKLPSNNPSAAMVAQISNTITLALSR